MSSKRKILFLLTLVGIFIFGSPITGYAMHIMEGILPLSWAIFWWLVTLPFLFYSIYHLKKITDSDPSLKMLLGIAGAFVFVLSALKLPSVTGSSSHPTGVGLGTVLFGPASMTLLGTIVLFFQATLLAHGGLTTLGANAFSMAIVGPFFGYGVYLLAKKCGLKSAVCVFLAAFFADLSTYVVTSLQLALVFPQGVGTEGFFLAFAKFAGIFATTQLPLAVVEGILTVLIFNFLKVYDGEDLRKLNVLSSEVQK